MADYIATTEELTAVADAIRAKGGTSEQLVFPDGFVSAISAISGGGCIGKPTAIDKCVWETGKVTQESGQGGIRISPNGALYKVISAIGFNPFSAEVYYTTDSEGYIFGFGKEAQRCCFAIASHKIVCYDDDHLYSEPHFGTHHLVLAYDGNGTITIYVDGSFSETIALGGRLNIGAHYMVYGCWLGNVSQETIVGTIHRARLYNDYLSAGDAAELYSYATAYV